MESTALGVKVSRGEPSKDDSTVAGLKALASFPSAPSPVENYDPSQELLSPPRARRHQLRRDEKRETTVETIESTIGPRHSTSFLSTTNTINPLRTPLKEHVNVLRSDLSSLVADDSSPTRQLISMKENAAPRQTAIRAKRPLQSSSVKDTSTKLITEKKSTKQSKAKNRLNATQSALPSSSPQHPSRSSRVRTAKVTPPSKDSKKRALPSPPMYDDDLRTLVRETQEEDYGNQRGPAGNSNAETNFAVQAGTTTEVVTDDRHDEIETVRTTDATKIPKGNESVSEMSNSRKEEKTNIAAGIDSPTLVIETPIEQPQDKTEPFEFPIIDEAIQETHMRTSPGVIDDWPELTTANSDESLEYVDPKDYTAFIQGKVNQKGKVADAKGEKEISTDHTLPLASSETKNDCNPTTATASALPTPTSITEHATAPIDKALSSPKIPRKPAEPSSRAVQIEDREKDRIFGFIDSDQEESETDAVIVGVKMMNASKSKVTRKSQPKTKVTDDPYLLPAKKQSKKKVKMLKGDSSREGHQVQESKTVRRPIKGVLDVGSIQGMMQSAAMDDLFGFGQAERHAEELNKEKEKERKKASDIYKPTENTTTEKEEDSQTQSDGQFTFQDGILPMMEEKGANKKVSTITNTMYDEDGDEELPLINLSSELAESSGRLGSQSIVDSQVIHDSESELSDMVSDMEIGKTVIGTKRKGKAQPSKKGKKKLTGRNEEEEEGDIQPKTTEEILALLNAEEPLPTKAKTQTQVGKGRKKTANATNKKSKDSERKLDLVSQENVPPKRSKKRPLEMEEQETVGSSRPSTKEKKSNGGKAAMLDLDDYSIPPGMTSSDVLSSRKGAMGRSKANKIVKVGAINSSKATSTAKPLRGLNPAPQENDWNARLVPKAKTKKASTKSQQAQVEEETQPIVTAATRKKKAKNVGMESEEEEEMNPDNARKMKEIGKLFREVDDYELEVEAA